jgi:redox-sensitive bicupin YhaK (pirin superfamily)
VINEDRVAPGTGFGTHGHRDMEIISYVLEGALAHQDSMGNGSTIVPGDVQRMSAGRGVRHSEFNNEKAGTTHFLQIWIEPDVTGIDPSYEQKHLMPRQAGRVRLVASPDGREGSVKIHQEAFLRGASRRCDRAAHKLQPGRRAYVHVARGKVAVSGELLEAGDALKAVNAVEIVLEKGEESEVLLFDLA